MTQQEITDQLQQIASAGNFPATSSELVAAWSAAGYGSEAVGPVLQFMETYPTIDYGAPGALVHFVERFQGKGYEDELIKSVDRKPTSTTLWMLNRVINGTRSTDERRELVAVMQNARSNPNADQSARRRARHFLEKLASN